MKYSINLIPEAAFNCSWLNKISFPKDLFSLKRKWAYKTKIKQIDISPTNPYLTYIDTEHKIIAGKTDPQSPVFDLLIFACRDVQNAYKDCKNLQTLQFAAGSSINILGDEYFKNCESILHVSLPAGLQKYGEFIFAECESLQTFDFLDREIFIDMGFFSCCRNLNIINCPNAEIIIYREISFKYIGQNFVVNRPQNAIFSDEESTENIQLAYKYRYDLEY